jgi:Arc/MetJ-type ribon-helix-helix transcriptional regulator
MIMEKMETKEKDSIEKKEKSRQNPLDEFGNQVEKFASKTAESIKKVIDKTLSSRNTVLTIRVNDECNTMMNMLVESGLFKSRSESAAFLIQEGIKKREDLFDKVKGKLEKMEKIREELKAIVTDEMSKEVDEPKKKKSPIKAK